MLRTRALLALCALTLACSGNVVEPGDGGPDAVVDGRAPDAAAPDVREPADVPPSDAPGLANGAPCASDEQCASNVCVNTPGFFPGGCAAPCTGDGQCDVGAGYSCAVDRPPTGGRGACGLLDAAIWSDGEECTADFECNSNLCLGGLCRRLCSTDTECTAGFRCIDTPVGARSVRACGHAPVTSVTVEDFTVFDESIDVDRSTERPVIVPDDAVSLAFIAQDLEGTELFASVANLRAPDSAFWINGRTWDYLTSQPVREILPVFQVNTALAPSSDTLPVVPGRYVAQFALFNNRGAMTSVLSRRARGIVRIKRAPGGALPASGALQLRLYFVGLGGTGPSASSAPSSGRLTRAITELQAIYGAVGITVTVAGYQDVTGADATRYGSIDSREELNGLFATSGDSMGDVINLYFVRTISDSAGLENAIGVAGDIVGPPGIHGTTNSGVVVSWQGTAGGGDLLAQTMAHECGHYLGLWHTRESQAPCTSGTQTMCSPFGGVDPISDTPTALAGSQSYLMHWQTNGSNNALSPGQGVVMRGNPLVR